MFSLCSPDQPQSNLFFRHYAPQTPSPLRTSQNANRIPTVMNPAKSSPLSENSTGDENRSPVDNKWDTPYTTKTYTASIFTPSAASLATPFTSSSTYSTIASTAKTPFTFEARARSSSPAAQLSRVSGEKRDFRKSRFLDRIRNRREEGRDEKMDEKVLRMDWVQERRGWEEDMRRCAAMMGDNVGEVEEEEGGVSPTEEKEIEELAEYFIGDEDMIDDGEVWDEVFMEVIEKERQPPRQSDILPSAGTETKPIQLGVQHDDMDMS